MKSLMTQELVSEIKDTQLLKLVIKSAAIDKVLYIKKYPN